MVPGWIADIPEIYWAIFFAFVIACVFGFRERLRAWADAKEAKVRARHAENARETRDPVAHFHLTIAEIEAGTPVPERVQWGGPERWRFGTGTFSSFEEADEARREAILTEARRFYQDIDRLQLGRR
jgi:hypothetical protein